MTAGVVNSAYEAVVPLAVPRPGRPVAGDRDRCRDELRSLRDAASGSGARFGFAGRDQRLGDIVDGCEVSFDTYPVTVLWEGPLKEVFADEADTTPLVGMLPMDGCDLNIQTRNGGRVLIQANAPQS